MLPIIALLSALGLMAPYTTHATTPAARIDSTRGLPDLEAQRAIYVEDSLSDAPELADSASLTVDAGDTLHLMQDGQTVLIRLDRISHEDGQIVARTDSTLTIRLDGCEHWTGTYVDACSDLPSDSIRTVRVPNIRPLAMRAPSAAAPVQLARLEIAEPARASTCYVGLDCPE
jgi:hypothetical protein